MAATPATVRRWNEIRPSFIAAYLVVIAVLLIYMLAKLDGGLETDVHRIRTDMEVHRARNEAAHQCMVDAVARLPTPEQRGAERFGVMFVARYRECVDQVAPTIVPPDVVDLEEDQ